MNLLDSRFVSTITCTCPRCHKGRLFLNRNPYTFSNWDKMNSHCNVCGLKYELEPGFFQGAMYVSYALAVGLSISIFLFVWITGIFTPFLFLVVNTTMLILLAPLLFRWARSLYLNLFVRYKKPGNT